MAEPYEKRLIVDVHVKIGCETDEVTTLSSISDTLYYIAEDGAVKFEPKWSHTEPHCPVEYLALRNEDGVLRPLNEAEKSIVSFDDKNGFMTLDTSDYALDGQVWSMQVIMRSTFSKMSSDKRDGTYAFNIEFRDVCWDSRLQAASFDETLITYDLWQVQKIAYTKMVDLSQGDKCGGRSDQVVYLSGPKRDETLAPVNADLSPFNFIQNDQNIGQMTMVGTAPDRSWLGTHVMQIKSTNGLKSSDPNARGNSGQFNSILSQPIVITIVDPCKNSVVNADGGLQVNNLSVPLGSESQSLSYAGPTDSISVKYGNGYDKCGELTYQWFDSTGSQIRNPNFSGRAILNQSEADKL